MIHKQTLKKVSKLSSPSFETDIVHIEENLIELRFILKVNQNVLSNSSKAQAQTGMRLTSDLLLHLWGTIRILYFWLTQKKFSFFSFLIFFLTDSISWLSQLCLFVLVPFYSFQLFPITAKLLQWKEIGRKEWFYSQ